MQFSWIEVNLACGRIKIDLSTQESYKWGLSQNRERGRPNEETTGWTGRRGAVGARKVRFWFKSCILSPAVGVRLVTVG